MDSGGTAAYPRLPLARFNKLVNLSLARLLKEAGCPITREQEVILRELCRNDCISQVELAKRVGQDPNNLSRTLALLEKRALISRAVRASDRRSSTVRITSAGRRLHAQAFETIRAYWQVLFQGFSPQEISDFANSLDRMIANLGDFVDSNGGG